MSILREAAIDVSAITANVAALRARVGTEHFLAVVKANGYGHGAVATACAAIEGGADWLGVLDATEAAELRDAGLRTPILTWLHSPSETFGDAVELDLDVAVSTLNELERARAAGVTHVQLKVDTGLSRNGAVPADWDRFFERARAVEQGGGPRIRGLFSHLANAGDEADADQLSAFNRARQLAASYGIEPELLHIAATEAALVRPEARFNLVRVGLGCYGLSPFPAIGPAEFGLTPVMELSSMVVSVKRVPAGSGVSYGHRYRTERETTLALVPIGYADGVPRVASNNGPVSINGHRFTVSGTIAMDQFVVDVGDAKVEVGDRVVLFGDAAKGLPAVHEWAAIADTIDYEIISRIGQRVPRHSVGGTR